MNNLELNRKKLLI